MVEEGLPDMGSPRWKGDIMCEDMMTRADKDLLLAFLDVSVSRVMKKDDWEFSVIPQGVTVVNVHPEGRIEYLFTKSDKYPVVRDDADVCGMHVDDFADGEPGLYFYLNSCMVPVASKHRRYAY
jgi:hypothetical protein